MSQKIVLKVGIAADRCKAACSRSVAAKFTGVKLITVDEEKGTLTVVGEVDVVSVVDALREAKFAVEVASVGPEQDREVR